MKLPTIIAGTMFLCFKFNPTNAVIQSCQIIKLSQPHFEQSGEKGYGVTCRNQSLAAIPPSYPPINPGSNLTLPLRLLDLGHNNLTRLENSSFLHKTNLNATDLMWLRLDFNSISFIETNALSNLTSLVYLNLSSNPLLWPASYSPGLFKPLISLDTLNLNGIRFDNFTNLGNELKVLKMLTNLFIDAQEKCVFGPGFKEMPRLTNVSLSSPLNQACRLPVITRDTFQYIPQVKMIWISSCNVKNITEDAFASFKGLELLDISYNEDLNFTGMNTALAGLRYSSSLRLLNVNHINTFLEAGITLKAKFLENLRTLDSLETLHMDLNKIEVLESSVLLKRYFPYSLRNLTLAGNRLTVGRYLTHLHHLTNVTVIDISRQHLNYDPYFWQHYEPTCESPFDGKMTGSVAGLNPGLNCSIMIPPDTERFLWNRSLLYTTLGELRICGAEHLLYLDLSFNLIHTWRGPIIGLENLQYLDLSDNTCSYISKTFFKRFQSLEELIIKNNYLGHTFDPHMNKEDTSEILQGLSKLKVLDMSYNKITNLHTQVFSGLVHLERLIIANNMLNEFSVDLSKSRCLNYLDLSGNKLTILSEALMDYLDSVTKEKCNAERNVKLMLPKNSLECSCVDLPFLKWISISRVHVYMENFDGCRIHGKKYRFHTADDFKYVVKILEHDVCNKKLWVTYLIGAGSLLVGLALSAVFCLAIYRNRWKLRYLYYSRNRRYHHLGFEHLFANDAMISYAKPRAMFVKDSLLPALERRGLGLWVADKHSLAGASIAENITHAIYNSRKTVLLLDKEYLKDSWCDYEMNMALVESVESERKLIIVVLMEQLKMDQLPIPILRLLRSERSLEFPANTDNLDTFWTNLAEEIQT